MFNFIMSRPPAQTNPPPAEPQSPPIKNFLATVLSATSAKFTTAKM